MMDKKLEKTIKEEEKLKEQLKALQDRINNVEEKRESFEKETLHKTFKETEISLEEYQMIVRTAVDDYKGLNDILVKGVQKDETEN
jgi:type IV secretory pathway VirB4 component